MLCVSCGSLVAVVRHWLGLRTRVMGVCSHVAGSGSRARAEAEGYCSETHQAGHRIGVEFHFSHTHFCLEVVRQNTSLRCQRCVKKVPGCCKYLPLNTWKIIYKQEIIRFQRTLLKHKGHHQTYFADGKREACLFSGC